MESLTPVVPVAPKPPMIPRGMQASCNEGAGCFRGDNPPPSPPNDPNYSTARNEPPNKTGEPGITLGSRNFNWSVPLVSLSGRSGMDLNLSLTYNSLVWTQESGMIKFNADQGFPGPGFRVGFPIVQPKYYNSDTGVWSYMMVTPSGGRTDLRQIGSSNIYESFDSSYTQLTDIDNGSSLLVRTSDSTQMTFVSGNGNYVCSQVEDRNGNLISATYNGSMPLTITDTLGRVIVFNYDNGFLASITQVWDGQTHTWATFGYNSIPFNYNFGQLQVNAPANGSVLALPTQVSLGDGSSYQFSYNTWGQVYQISHYAPDGTTQLAYALYNLPLDAANAQTDCPRFTERHDWARDWNVVNGMATEVVTQLGVDSDGGQVMIAPDGTKYKELDYASGWQNGLPQQEEWWSGGVRQKWATYSWTQDNVNVSYQINPRLTGTTIGDANNNLRPSGISYTAFTLPSGTACNVPSDVTEYATDNTTVLRRTHTDYNLDAAYLDRRLIGLVSSSSIYDGSGTLFAKTDFHYDESSPQDPGAIVQHTSIDGVRGNQTSVTRFDVNNLSQSVTSSIAYNTAGSVVRTTDPLGHQTNISYNDSRSTFAYPTTVTDADGNATTSQYDYDMGVLTQAQTPPPQGFPDGPIETRQYDNARRLVQATNNANGAYTRWFYDPSQMFVQTFTTIQDGAGEAYSVQVFDGAGRLRAAAQDHPGSSGKYSGQYTIFDVMGRAVQQSNPTEMDGGWNNTGDDAGGWIYTQQAYDWKGRPTITTNADNTQRTLSYGGCGCAGGEVVTARDEHGRQRRTTADTLGRLARVEEFNDDGSVYATTNYVYDPLDHLRSIDQQGLPRSFDYDGYGRLWRRTTPEQGTTTYSYNSDDTTSVITDARNVTTSYGYNNRHQVTSLTYNVSGDPTGQTTATASVGFGYDAAGNRTSMTDGLGQVTYGYDKLSRMTAETRTFNGLGSYTLNYSYNLAGELTGITGPSQFGSVNVGYQYDVTGRLTNVSGANYASVSSYASSLTYRAFGGIKGMNYGDGHSLSTAYDTRLRPTTWNVSGVLGYNYAYDYFNEHTGRVTYAQSINDPTGSLDRSYQYDNVGRLRVAHSGAEARLATGQGPSGTMDGPYSLGFEYDQFGNMFHRYGWGGEVQGGGADETSHLFYNYANNRRTDSGFVYDAAGNVINDGAQAYQYDATGQQTLATTLGGGGGGTPPTFSAPDPLTPGTEIKLEHLTELRTAVNQLRARAGLAAFSFTVDPSPQQYVTLVDHNHIQQLRTALEQALNALHLPIGSYAHAGPNQGDTIYAIDFQELRDKIKAAYNAPTSSTMFQSYDGGGLRVKKNENGATTWYLRSTVLGGQVIAELDANGGWSRGYVYAGSNLMAVQQGGVFWVYEDSVTKSKRTTDINGQIVSAIELDPFGADTSRSWGQAFQPRKFTSYDRDGNGSDEAMFRRYNRNHSRFDQPDPSGGSYDLSDPQSFNRYSYVQNDPVNAVDATGLESMATGCSAAYSSCNGGWDNGGSGYSGTPFDSGSILFGGYNEVPAGIRGALAAFDQHVQNTRDQLRAQSAWTNGNFGLVSSIIGSNPDIGVSVNGLQLWGDLALAFIDGYSQPIEIAQRAGIPPGAVGYAVRKGLEAVARFVQKIRAPDFYLLTGAYLAEGTVAMTRGGTFTISIGASSGAQGSLLAGWMLQREKPLDRDVVDFLTGPSGAGEIFWNPRTGLGAGIGGGFMKSPWSSGTQWAVLLGLGIGGGGSSTVGNSARDWYDLTKRHFAGRN